MLVLVMTAVCLVPTSFGIQASAYTEVDAVIHGKDFDYNQNSDNTLTIISYNGSNTNLVIPETIGGKTVTGVIASSGSLVTDKTIREKIVSVTLPKTVTEIGNQTFEEMTNLKTVTINGKVTRLGGYAFYKCTSLATVKLPDGLKEIGYNAFSKCTALKSIVLPSSLTTIESSAFSGCTNLASITIPSSVTSLGAYCFKDTKWLSDRYKDYSSHIVAKNGILIDGTKYEGETLTIPDNITAVAPCAFEGNTYLKRISFPSSVKSIGSSAFQNAKNLATISGSESLTDFGANAFDNTKWLYDMKSKYTIVVVNGVLIDGKSAKGSITIPSTVKKIGPYAFYNNKKITAVTIPSSVKQIEYSAFGYCSGLTGVKLTNGLTAIGNSAFTHCEKLSSITFPSTLKTIGSEAFYSCSDLKKIIIPSNVTSIGESAFYNCFSATVLELPTTPLTIGDSAFRGCYNVERLFVPKNLKIVGSYVFADMGLRSITFEDGVTKISPYEFAFCVSLSNVVLPDSVVKIGRGGFGRCLSLDNISIPRSTVSIMSIAFDNCLNLGAIYITHNVKTIGEDAFNRCSNLQIKCQKGSTIDTYAQKNKIPVSYFTISSSRIYGNNRYTTATNIAKTAYPKGTPMVVITSGTQFADALASVPLAKLRNAPILLSTVNGLDKTTLTLIKNMEVKEAFIFGGTGAVPANVETQLDKLGVYCVRFGGANRYETAAHIADIVVRWNASDTVYLINGSSYADALSASPAAAISNAPILYTKPDGTLDENTKSFLKNMKGLKDIKVVGGKGLIPDATIKTLAAYVSDASHVERMAGSNRYETCINVNKACASLFTGNAVCVVTGKDFPDAFTAGVYAAMNKSPLFLADDTLNSSQKTYLMNKLPEKVIAFGGAAVVPSEMLTKIVSTVKAGW